WFAAIFARSRLGIAIAAMIKMIATTMSNSISEKPFWFFFIVSPWIQSRMFLVLPGGVRSDIVHGMCQAGAVGYRYGTRHYNRPFHRDTDAVLGSRVGCIRGLGAMGPKNDGFWQSYPTETVQTAFQDGL